MKAAKTFVRDIFWIVLAVGAALMWGRLAHAETIQSSQDPSLFLSGAGVTGGTKLNGVACTAAAASRWTGWIYVQLQSNLVLDFDFVDGDASAANLGWRCETSRSNATANDAGRDLPIDVSTSAAGVTTFMPASWVWVATTGGPPGTSRGTLTIANIPAPFINCLATCGAGGDAGDTITAFARGTSP